jgi:UDP-N-acetylmuramate--alanine ligase
MAGVAFLLKERGLDVSGCDLQENRQTEWLRGSGVDIAAEHHTSHVSDAVGWVIRSTAVPDTHPEIRKANELGIPVSRRGEVLPALMRDRTCIAVGGTHGKTTTTAMIAQALGCGYCIGGEMAGTKAVARDGNIMVVEADESDGTIAGYAPDIAVITNIEYDHMEHHASEAAFIGCFEQLVDRTRKTVHYRADDPIAKAICDGNPKCKPFNYPATAIPLPLPGRHNQWNAAAALAACSYFKPLCEVVAALSEMRPISRRFETVSERDGIRIVSDYAHHPTEIAAVIQTALELEPRRLLGVFQPHRYTRTLALGPDFPASFTGMDKLWLVPVYAASEQPLDGGTSKDLLACFSDEGRLAVDYCPDMISAWKAIRSELTEGDLLLILGAGDIGQMADWARN